MAAKPQLACFERHGAAGWAALEAVAKAARSAGLLVLADGKRGDVPHTAAVYAQGLFGQDGLGADAATVNPLLGGDSLEPFIATAAECGAGVFTLVLTSNPGAADFLDPEDEGEPLAERIAELVGTQAGRLGGAEGLSGLGAVIGATKSPSRLARLRELMPTSIFLLPGVGAQGGDPGALAAAVGNHPASILVPVSRGISGADDPAAAAEGLRAELWSATGADG